MFDRVLATRSYRWEPRGLSLTLLAFLLHAFAGGGVLLLSWLQVSPLIPPRAEIIYFRPPALPRAGAPAPRLGHRSPSRPSDPVAVAVPPPPPAILQPQETPAIPPPEVPPAVQTPGGTQGAASENPGDPDGAPDGKLGGKGRCLSNCDPEGPLDWPGEGFPGGTEGAVGPRYPWSQGVTEPVLIESSRTLPRYPELARRSGVEGSVILQAVIQTDGTVGSLMVLRETPGRMGFKQAAIEAISRWRYRPGLQYGRPVAIYLTITVDFTLSR
jgi:periplasmic protein TonB